MIEAIYTWMKNIVFYLVIITAVLEVLPGINYQKYIRFFTGLVLMMLLLTPFLSLTEAGEIFSDLYHGYEYEQYKRELQEQEEYFQDLDLLDFLPEEYFVTESSEDATSAFSQGEEKTGATDREIEVEDIRIGEEME